MGSIPDSVFKGANTVAEAQAGCLPRRSKAFVGFCQVPVTYTLHLVVHLTAVQHQGDPFGLPGFSPPRLPVAGLSAPRLQLDAAALAGLPPLLDAVRRRQAELNPRAPRLLRRLEDAARQVRALGAAVETVLAALGAADPGPRPEPPATAAAAAAGTFQAKVLGLRVCGLCREWVSRTEGDLGPLLPGGPA
uniref:Cardiotrophin 1 n=1 Tax=Oryctolagus cuniculus TaxID=9986 RepID=G1SPG1_RABIT